MQLIICQCVAERSKAPNSKARGGRFDSRWKTIFILNFSLVSRSSKLGKAYTNNAKHDIHPNY